MATRVSHLLAALIVFAAGFAGGTYVALQYPELLRTTATGQSLYDMLQQGTIELGSDMGDLVLPDSTAYHERTDASGQTLVTAVYQQQGQVLLLQAADDKVTELTLWKNKYRTPDLYFVRSPP